jgi:hypothetical protein
MANMCEAMIPIPNNFGRAHRCACRYSMKVSVNALISYDIMCCKKHVRKICVEAINQGNNVEVFQKIKFEGIPTFVPYPLNNIKNLPFQAPLVQVPLVQVPLVQVPLVQVPLVQVPLVQAPVLTLTPVLDAGQHPCCICFDDTDDVRCTGKRHTLCNSCFNGHVVAEAKRPEFNGTVKCPLNRMSECDCEGFTVSFIAKHTTDQTFNEYDRKRYDIKEKTAIHKFQEDFQKKLQLENTLSQSEKDMNYVLDNIFTLKCPHCSAAYADFDGCLAVVCSSCSKSFCGKCNAACKDKTHAHQHAHYCTFGGCPLGYFLPINIIKKSQNEIRRIALQKFLQNKSNKSDILLLIKKDMQQLGM